MRKIIYKLLQSLLLVCVLVTFSVVLYSLLVKYWQIEEELKGDVILILVTSIFSTLGILFLNNSLSKKAGKKETFAYNIAIIGLPKSGKTTFITSLFGAIIHGKIKMNDYDVLLKGNATIEMVNENLSLLDKGVAIGATTDQTIFSYRVNLEEKDSSFFRAQKAYNVEIGDFQGEMTRDLIDLSTKMWRHDSDFFNWVKDADAFVFIVDLAQYLKNEKEYIADISKSFRSAWQKILELNSMQVHKMRRKPIQIIFNKADVLVDSYEYPINKIDSIAFARKGEMLPKIRYENIDSEKAKEISEQFSDMLNFFCYNSKNVNSCFYSSFLADKYEYRYGLTNIVNHIFPNRKHN